MHERMVNWICGAFSLSKTFNKFREKDSRRKLLSLSL